MRIVYIMGCGRSGSTLLNTVLADHPSVFGAGELSNLISAMDVRHNYCACGVRSTDCSAWNAVREEWTRSTGPMNTEDYERLRVRFERIRAWPRYWMPGLDDDPSFRRYLTQTSALIEAVGKISGAEAIIDASKTPMRALALSRMKNMELRVIHLVRDVRGVALSLMKPWDPDPEGGIMTAMPRRSPLGTAARWLITNAMADRVRSRLSAHAMLLRYEDFVTNPTMALRRIATLTGFDFAPTMMKLDQNGTFRSGHIIEGNRSRMHQQIRLDPDTRWHNELALRWKRSLAWLAAPVGWSYGYRLWD